MAGEAVSATTIINAPAGAIFTVLADPARHAAIDGTGWVCEPLDLQPLTAAGQVFRMTMYPPRPPGRELPDGQPGAGVRPPARHLLGAGASLRQHIGFPPFPPDHLGNSLAHLAELTIA